MEALLASALTVTDDSEENVYIDNLVLKNAHMIEAAIGTLICEASEQRVFRWDHRTGSIGSTDSSKAGIEEGM